MFTSFLKNKSYPVLFLVSIISLLAVNILHYHKINLLGDVQNISASANKVLTGSNDESDNLDFCNVEHLSSSLINTSSVSVETVQLRVLGSLTLVNETDFPQFHYSYSQLRAPPLPSAV